MSLTFTHYNVSEPETVNTFSEEIQRTRTIGSQKLNNVGL
jgi:hypothetical protein